MGRVSEVQRDAPGQPSDAGHAGSLCGGEWMDYALGGNAAAPAPGSIYPAARAGGSWGRVCPACGGSSIQGTGANGQVVLSQEQLPQCQVGTGAVGGARPV